MIPKQLTNPVIVALNCLNLTLNTGRSVTFIITCSGVSLKPDLISSSVVGA